jgi:hypothetical protein
VKKDIGSVIMTTNDIGTIASQISDHVKLFHQNPTTERSRSQILEKFQHSQQALQVSSMLLQDSTQSDYVLNFAAHTIVQKVQSRTVPFSVDFGPSLLSLISLYGTSTKHASISKMLCQAFVDYVLMNYAECQGSQLGSQLSSIPPHCAVVIFSLLPEEARNVKIFPKGAKRAELYNSVITDHSTSAFEYIQRAGVTRESLVALKTWIRVQRFSSEVRMKRTWGDMYSCSEVVPLLPTMNIFRQSLAALHNPSIPLSTAELCAEIVVEALRLTNDPSEHMEFIVSMGEAIAELGRALTGSMPTGTERFLAEQSAQDSQLVGRIKLFCVLMSEFALIHYIPILLTLLNQDESGGAAISKSLRTRAEGVIQNLSESGLQFVAIRHHEIAIQALDFWYNLLSALLGATDIEDDEDELFVGSDEVQTSAQGGSAFGARSMHLARRFIGDDEVSEVGPVIAPFFKRLLPTLVQAMCYPSVPENDPNFEPELFTQFREIAGNVVSESCELVDPLWMIQLIGESLTSVLANQENQWHTLEACIHVLTAVAPRLPAGADPVIPMMLESVPSLSYPDRGEASVLLRAAIGRLVLYTSVYLSTRTDLCVQIVVFFCSSQILPFLSSSASRQFCPLEMLNSSQSACAQAVKMALHSARRSLVALPQDRLAPLLEQAFVSALDERLSLDSRLQIVRGVGSVLSELGTWTLIRQSLQAFATRAGQQAQAQLELFASGPPPNNPNAMGPASVKIYISVLSSVASLPDDSSLIPPGSHSDSAEVDRILAANHPVLAVLADQWPLVERICTTVGCAYSDIAQVMATSFVQIFAHTRSFASHSAPFLPALRTAARCFLTRPISDWMHMVRSFVSMFGEYTRVDTALVETLCQLSETFVKHSAEILTTNTEMRELTFDEARMVAETFEVLSEVLRFVDLASVELKQPWFRPIAIVAVQCLFDSPVDSQTLPAITALLRFTERLVTWIDPPPVIHAAADTERVCFETSACVRGWLQESYYNPSKRGQSLIVTGGNLIDTLIVALANMWAVKSSEFPQILPSTSTSLRISLNSSLGGQVAGRLQKHAETDWMTLIPGERLRQLFAQMDQFKRDSRGFGRIIADMAKEFHSARKQALFNQ